MTDSMYENMVRNNDMEKYFGIWITSFKMNTNKPTPKYELQPEFKKRHKIKPLNFK